MSEPLQQTPSVDRTKLAALRLHTLSSRDRRWMLRQLPRDQRRQIEAHLARLRRLPVADALALIDEARAQLQQAKQAPRVATIPAESAHERLLSVEVDRIRPVLDALPAGIAGVVCRAAGDRAAWCNAYIAQTDAERRRGIEAAMNRQVASKASHVLLHAVTEAIPDAAPADSFADRLSAAAAERPRGLRRLRRILFR